jgi:hypothetical protein
MVLKVRFAGRRRLERERRRSQFAIAACSLLQPVALGVWCVAGWRAGVDLGWTTGFPVTSGLLSHWQVWFAMALTIQFVAYLLQRLFAFPEEKETERRPSQPRSGLAA